MDLVSVIIPTHKGNEYIEKAVKSILNQTYQNIEIIVVDDNGIGTAEQILTQNKLQNYIDNKDILYIPHLVNKNGSTARNTGFKNSNGKFICLLDDDDEYYPDKVEKQVEILSTLGDDWGMVYCSMDGSKKAKSGNILYEVLVHSVVIGSNSFMVKRRIWEELNGFDESFRRHQDYEFTARVADICKIKYIPFVGFKSSETFRNNPKNIEQAQSYRAHYLNKMMPLICKFSVTRQKMIICYNAMEVTSKGSLLKINELKNYASQWNPKFGITIILLVSIAKFIRKIKWKIITISR